MIRRGRPLQALSLALALLAASAVQAHEGINHAEAEAPAHAPASAQAPRIAFTTPQVEVLVVREPKALVIYVDDYASNAPRTGLQLSLQSGNQLVAASAAADGSYRVPTDALGADADAALPLHLRLRGDGLDETLRGELPAALAENETETEAEAEAPSGPAWKAGAAGLLGIGLLAGLVLRLRRRR